MAKQTVTLHVHAYFDTKGKFCSFGVQMYKMDRGMGQYGMWVHLHSINVAYEVPDDISAICVKGAQELTEAIQVERGKAQLRLMQLEAVRNSMLGLEAPDVIRGDERKGEGEDEDKDEDKDIPF